MVDLETHKIVDMLESREGRDVSKWLAEYPNINVVSRDGSQTYAAAITEAHPKAVQISDRFHIIKNLCERATQAFQKMFQGRIAIPMTSETRQYQTLMLIGTTAERAALVQKLYKNGKTQGEIATLTGSSEKTIKKYIRMREDEIPEDKQTVRGREHEEAVEKVKKRAQRVRELHSEGFSIKAISQRTGFTAYIIQRYLSDDFSPINAHYGKQCEGKPEPFRAEAFRLKSEGFKYREIYDHLRGKGYTGTQDAIRGFISKERRIQRDLLTMPDADGTPQEFVDKKWLIQLPYKSPEKIRGISQAQISAIFSAHPVSKSILDAVIEFKKLMKSRNEAALSDWMTRTPALGITELDTFIAGLNQDIHAVMNSLAFDFSNGLAEGTVNKIKVVKRIMYGRCHFPLLRNKCLLLNAPSR